MWNGVWVGRGREWDHSFSPLSLEDETGLDWIAKARHPAVVQSNPPPRPTAAPAAPDGARPRWIRRRTPNWYDRALPVSLMLSPPELPLLSSPLLSRFTKGERESEPIYSRRMADDAKRRECGEGTETLPPLLFFSDSARQFSSTPAPRLIWAVRSKSSPTDSSKRGTRFFSPRQILSVC